jgi:enamine deaminase RidA (YjgF/YER057c/UK114 family)
MPEQHTNANEPPQILQPSAWPRPSGYTSGLVTRGRLIFLSGQIGWDDQQRFQSTNFLAQARQALQNILTILAEADAQPEHIVRLTWYIVDKQEYLACVKELGTIYRELMGKHYPTMTMIQVASLIEDQARVEIEATAVLPE